MSGRRRRSLPAHHLGSQQPGRTQEQHQQQDDEGDGVLVAGRDDPDAQSLDDAEDEAAHHRAERVAQPAERRRREALQTQERPGVSSS